MEKVAVKKNWDDVKMKARKAYPNLTDEDLTFKEGKENEMIDKIQKKIGKSREETAAWLKTLETESTRTEGGHEGKQEGRSEGGKTEEKTHSKSSYKSE